jgi:hypothetical protein
VASKELDLARVDGMAGVRSGHEGMGGVKRWERGEGRWMSGGGENGDDE